MRDRRKTVYFELEMKKGIALVPSFFLMLAVTAGILLLASFVTSAAMKKESALPRLLVAVVSPDEDEMTMTAAGMIESMNSVRSIASISMTDRETAEKGFDEGSVQAIIYLPENMYESIDSGENLPVTVRISNESGLASRLFRELIESGVSLVQTSESSIYATAQVSLTYPLKGSSEDLMNAMAKSYISSILNRSRTWNTTLLSAYGDLTEIQYFVMSVVLVTLLLFGAAFAVFYSDGEVRSGKMLTRCGVGPFAQSSAKIASMTLVLWILLAVWYLILFFADFVEFDAFSIPLLLFVAFSAAAFVHLVYSVAHGERAVFFYVVAALLLFLLSGGIVPSSLFPPALARAAHVLPSYHWEKFLAAVLYGKAGGLSLAEMRTTAVIILVYGTVMAAAGAWRWNYAEN